MNFTTADLIAIATLITTSVTAICTLYLALASLHHAAKPKIKVEMQTVRRQRTDTLQQYVFTYVNIGHWYGKPLAINVTTFINFDPAFELIGMRFGANLDYQYTKERFAVDGFRYMKSTGVKLSHGEPGERAVVDLKTPVKPGAYKIRLTAFSDNGLDCRRTFTIRVYNAKGKLT